MTTVGFVGLGQMGTPMARHLVDWPGGLVVYDTRPDATTPFVEAEAAAAESVPDLAERADVISVMVRDDEQVREVVGAMLESAAAGTVIAIHSTIAAATAEELAARAEPYGIDIVDAPVSGGFMGAHDGRLAVLAGGAAWAVEACRKPFGAWADLIVHMGPVGVGTRAKLARNLIQFVAFAAVTEAQRLAEAAGLDLTELGRVVRHSDAVTGGPGAIMLRPTAAPMSPDDDWYGVLDNVRALGEKDLTLALDLGAQLGVDLPLAQVALQRLASGLGVAGDVKERR